MVGSWDIIHVILVTCRKFHLIHFTCMVTKDKILFSLLTFVFYMPSKLHPILLLEFCSNCGKNKNNMTLRTKYHLSSDTADREECGLSCIIIQAGFLKLNHVVALYKYRVLCVCVCTCAWMCAWVCQAPQALYTDSQDKALPSWF